MISVVIPIYNADQYLNRCLQSIKNQTYSDFEVIMVNDGSSDNSKEICVNYADNDSRFIYLEQINMGPDIARKTGVQKATGEYLMYVDADDYIKSSMLQILIEKSEEYNADIVCSNVTRFDDRGKEWNSDDWVTEIIECNDFRDIFKEYFVTRRIIGCYYAKLYKTELFKEYGFIKDSLIGEDISGVIYALQKAQKIILIPESFYFYYWNLSSISHTKYNMRHKISLDNYIRLKKEVIGMDIIEEKYVCGYFAEFEMAVATAMSRARAYDIDTINVLRSDLKNYWKMIKSNPKTPFYMKMCIRCFIFSPKLFIFLYRIVYLVTGR
ncbi:MAG: glycosyltransferase [Lachnospiraceae bacterium]|nr:glycosyltransferase [Lachnospiraceae bacterium]